MDSDAVTEAHAVSKPASATERWLRDELLHEYAPIPLDDPLGSHVVRGSREVDITKALGLRLAQHFV